MIVITEEMTKAEHFEIRSIHVEGHGRRAWRNNRELPGGTTIWGIRLRAAAGLEDGWFSYAYVHRRSAMKMIRKFVVCDALCDYMFVRANFGSKARVLHSWATPEEID